VSKSVKIHAEMLSSSVPTRITELIQRHGIKQLSDRTGISGVQIGRYGKGQSQPTAEKIIALAIAGGVTTQWLLCGEGEGLSVRDGGAIYDVSSREQDSQAIVKIVATLEELLSETGRGLSPTQKGETVAAFFDMYKLNASTLEDVVFRQLLKTYISASAR
jgi:transcriptional regulator with XRE-family HTH domain